MEIKQTPNSNLSGEYQPSLETASKDVPKTKPDLTETSDKLIEARYLVADSSTTATQPSKTAEVQFEKAAESDSPAKKPLTPEAVYDIKQYYPKLISPDGRFLFYLEDGKRHILDIKTKKNVCQEILDKISKDNGQIIDFSEDGLSLVCLSSKNWQPFDTESISPETIIVRGGPRDYELYRINLKTGAKEILMALNNVNYTIDLEKIKYNSKENAIYISCEPKTNFAKNTPASYPEQINLETIFKINLTNNNHNKPEEIYKNLHGNRLIADYQVSPDERYIALKTRHIDGVNDKFEIILYDAKEKREYKITDNLKREFLCGWSNDSRYLIFKKDSRDNNINSQNELCMFDTNKLKQADIKNEYKISFENDVECITGGMDIGVENVVLVKNEPCLYFSTSHSFYNNVYRYKFGSSKPPELILGDEQHYIRDENIIVSGDGGKLYFNEDTPEAPAVLSCCDTQSNKREEVLSLNKDFFKRYVVPEQKIENFKYYNSEKNEKINIEYSITYPPDYKENDNKNYPLILLIHGGPNGRFTSSISIPEQPNLLATQGYIVICPNIRGSEGYGENFLEAIYADKKGNLSSKGYADLMATVDHVAIEHPGKIDEAKMGIYGYSYGGSMTNYIITRNNRFSAAIAGAGQSAYISDIENRRGFFNTHFPNHDFSKQTVERLLEASPLGQNTNSVQTPLLLIHGNEDGTVPIQDSKNFYEELKRKNKNVRFIEYQGVGHAILNGKAGWITHHNYIINWFNHYLQPEKEVYDSETYQIYSGDGIKELKDISILSGTKPINETKPKKGKFALIKFTVDARDIFTFNIFKKNLILEDKTGNKYEPIGKIENGKLKEIDEKLIYSGESKTFTLVFDVPKDAEEFVLRIKDFPPIRIKTK